MRPTDGMKNLLNARSDNKYGLSLNNQIRQQHRVGEKLFVDYCGPRLAMVNPDTGEIRHAQVFVAVLGASSYTFAEAT